MFGRIDATSINTSSFFSKNIKTYSKAVIGDIIETLELSEEAKNQIGNLRSQNSSRASEAKIIGDYLVCEYGQYKSATALKIEESEIIMSGWYFNNNNYTGSMGNGDPGIAADATGTCVSVSNMNRESGTNSTTDGNTGRAICVGAFGVNNTWVDNDPRAIKFTLTYPADKSGHLSKLEFYQQSPLTNHWYPEDIDVCNNPAQKFGFRVLKDNVEIYESIDHLSSATWEFESFDFTGDSDFEFTNGATFLFEILAYDKNDVNCYNNIIGTEPVMWDLDDVEVLGYCTSATGCDNKISNEEFDNGTNDWLLHVDGSTAAGAVWNIDNSNQLSGTNSVFVNITNATNSSWNIQLLQENKSIIAGTEYQVIFEGRATAERNILAAVQRNSGTWDTYGSQTVNLTTEPQTYSFKFIAPETNIGGAALIFHLATSTDNVYIDNVRFSETCVTEICDNNIDDDGDGLIDNADDDCSTSVACTSCTGNNLFDNPSFETGTWSGSETFLTGIFATNLTNNPSYPLDFWGYDNALWVESNKATDGNRFVYLNNDTDESVCFSQLYTFGNGNEINDCDTYQICFDWASFNSDYVNGRTTYSQPSVDFIFRDNAGQKIKFVSVPLGEAIANQNWNSLTWQNLSFSFQFVGNLTVPANTSDIKVLISERDGYNNGLLLDNTSLCLVNTCNNTCGPIQIDNVTVSNCIDQPLLDIATVEVEVSWTNAPLNDTIEVNIDNQTEYIDVAGGITSPQTLHFTIPADGSTNNTIIANWRNIAGCETNTNYNAPVPCSANEITCDILYICGDDKPYDGDAWDHGWIVYLDAVNGSGNITPAFSKVDASGIGLYDPNNTSNALSIDFADYDLIIVSATTEGRLSNDIIDSLANTSVSVLNSNYTIVNDMGMTATEADYEWQNEAYTDNANRATIYNFNNKVSPWTNTVVLAGDYNANADVLLWEGSGDKMAGVDGVLFHYTSDDALSGVSANHGNRVFLGLHMNGAYANNDNGGIIPVPDSLWFDPAKHLTVVGKTYLDSALILASANCSFLPTNACALTNIYPGFPIDFLNDNSGWNDYNLGNDLELIDNGDGTKTITGSITDGTPVDFGSGVNGTSCGATDGWSMTLTLSDKMDWTTFQTAGGSANVHANCNAQITNLDYWDVSGTLTGTGCNTGRTLTINGPKAPYRLQIGYGGNNGDAACDFGMSTWFDIEENGSTINADIYAFLNESCYNTTYSNKDVCYLISDGEGDGYLTADTFYTFNHTTGAVVAVGETGTLNIEAMAYDTVNQIIYAADDDDFGTINIATGVFTAITTDMGNLNGAAGNDNVNGLDGMTYDYANNLIWATERASGTDGLPDDMLLKIDPATGMPLPNGFGAGIGYLVIATNEHDLDDIAMAADGTLYAISNFGGSGNQRLGTINTTTGIFTEIGDYGIEDVESLTFTATGQLLATTGEDGRQKNSLFSIDAATAIATFIGSIEPGHDVEACVCSFGNLSNLQIGDKVWADLNNDGLQDVDEPGLKDVKVNLLDENGNAFLDNVNNPMTTITDIHGIYNFAGLAAGNYIVEFELPTGTSFATKDVGGDDTKDSDADGTTGRTGIITISGSINNLDADAGILNANVVIRDCTNDGELFVLDEAGGVLLRYNSTTGVLIDTFIQGFIQPMEMIVGNDDYLYISDRGLQEIRRYSLITGAFIDVLARNLNAPVGMTFGADGMLYVNHKNRDEVLKINPSDGTTSTFITNQLGGLDGNYGGIEFGPDGNLYVTSRNTDEVLRYNGTTGAFINVFVTAGSGSLNGPDNLTFGSNGDLYVTSSYSDQVKRYNGTTGAFISDFVTYRSGGLRRPLNVVFGSDGNIYVSGQDSPEGIYRYNESTGAFVDLFATGIDEPRGVLFAPVPNCDNTSCCSQINYANNSLEDGNFSSFTSSANPDGSATLTTFGGSDAIDWDPSGGIGTNGSPITAFGANPGYWVDASTNGGSGSLDGNRFYWLEPRTGVNGSDCIGAVGGSDLLGSFCQGDTVEICGYVASYDPNNINSGAASTDFKFEIYTNNGNDPVDFISTPTGTTSVNDDGGNNESFTLPLPASINLLDITGATFTGANGQVADWRTLNWQSVCFQLVLKEDQSNYTSIAFSMGDDSAGMAVDNLSIRDITTPDAGKDTTYYNCSGMIDLNDAQSGQTWSKVTEPSGATATIDATTGVVTGLTENGDYKFLLARISDPTCHDTIRVIVKCQDEICDDNIDNDGDGLVDSTDPDCPINEVCTCANSNLLDNPGFESGNFTGADEFIAGVQSDYLGWNWGTPSGLDGWSHGALYWVESPNSNEGNRMVYINNPNGGSVCQGQYYDLGGGVGQMAECATYQLCFDWASFNRENPTGRDTTSQPAIDLVWFDADGNDLGVVHQVLGVPVANQDWDNLIWSSISFSFSLTGTYEPPANATEVRINISEHNGEDNGLLIDNANLCEVMPCPTEICDDNIDNDGDGLTDCEDPDCSTINISSLSFSECILMGDEYHATLTMVVEWINPPAGEGIDVVLPYNSQFIDIVGGAVSPYTLQFVIDADNSANQFSLSYSGGSSCSFDSYYESPAPCPPPTDRDKPCNNATGHVGGIVFEDLNGDGLQDSGEPGIPGILVTATDSTAATVGRTTTNNLGVFEFDDLTDGERLRIEFTAIPSGMYPTNGSTYKGTTIQFVEAPTCATTLGLLDPTDNPCTGGAISILQNGHSIVGCLPAGDNVTLAIKDVSQLGTLWQTPANRNNNQSANVSTIQMWETSDFEGEEIFSMAVDPRDGTIYAIASPLYSPDPQVPGVLFEEVVSPKVFKINGKTGNVTRIAELNGSLGLGYVDFDLVNEQLFISNMDDGKIYRLNTDGAVLGSFDPLVADNGVKGQLPLLGDRILGVTFNPIDKRVYYAVWANHTTSDGSYFRVNNNYNSIRSIALDANGDFLPATDQLEFNVPYAYSVDNYTSPIGDIAFNRAGDRLLVAETPLYEIDVTNQISTTAHLATLREFSKTTGSWIIEPTYGSNSEGKYDIGSQLFYKGRNSRGGVDWAFESVSGNTINGDDEYILAVGDAIHIQGADGNDIYGYQFTPATGGNITNSVLVDLDDDTVNPYKYVYGDVDVYKNYCATLSLEIGNYVWLDMDEDGIQDPNENGIPNVNVTLYNAAGDSLTTVITNNDGEYYFSEYTTGFSGLTPNTTYYVTIGKGGQFNTTNATLNNNYGITLANTGTGSYSDWNDSDAIIGNTGNGHPAFVDGYPFIEITTGAMGENDHSFDFGFAELCSVTNAVNDSLNLCPGLNFSGSVAQNDSNLDNKIFSLLTPPTHGTVTVDTNGAFDYVSTTTLCGTDQFTYQVCDPASICCTSAVVHLSFEDTTKPTLLNVPADDTISCDEELPLPPQIFALDNCPQIALNVKEESTQGEDGCSLYDYTITRTWTATDKCGNSTSDSQIVDVQDVVAPDIYRIYTLPNGKKMVAGVMEFVGKNWKTVNLPIDFDTEPIILHQVVTTNDITPVVSQIRNTSVSQFELRIQEEENEDNIHTRESIAWIAMEGGLQGSVYQLEMASLFLSDASTNVSFLNAFTTTPALFTSTQTTNEVDPFSIRHNNLTATGMNLAIQEESSKDAEVAHANEKIGYLAIEKVGDLREERGILMGEVGTTALSNTWTTINLNNSYHNPVIIANSLSIVDGAAATVRIRNVGLTSFEVRVEEWDYLDGNHGNETVNYIVIEGSIPLESPNYCDIGTDSLDIGIDFKSVDNCDVSVVINYSETSVFFGAKKIIQRTWAAEDECGNANSYTQEITCEGVSLRVKSVLQGAMLGNYTDGLMRDDLRKKGILPYEEPYSKMSRFKHVKGGGEVADSSVFQIEGANGIVDWVFLELRDPNDVENVLATMSALIQCDGDVVSAQGDSILHFKNSPIGDYFVAIRHRNHLGTVGLNTYTFSQNQVPFVDFAYNFTPVAGSNPSVEIDNLESLWSGDLNNDGKVIYQGPNNDIFYMFLHILQEEDNTEFLPNYISRGYTPNDFNLDGTVIFQGPNNDRANLLFSTILSHPLNTQRFSNFIIFIGN